MDMNSILTKFIFWILPIIVGIGVYYSPRRYPSVITRIDSFEDWIDKKREGIKEAKRNLRYYFKYIIYVSFNKLMKLTKRIENDSTRSGVRVTLSIYLSYFLFYIIGLITAIVVFGVLFILALMFYGRFGDTIEKELRRGWLK
jgi:predicted PurR-regulated permease PerM